MPSILTWMLLIQTNHAKRAVIEIEDSASVKLTAGQGIVIIDNQGNVEVHRTTEMVPHDLLKMIARDWLTVMTHLDGRPDEQVPKQRK